MNFQRSRDSYSMGTHKGIYGDEITSLQLLHVPTASYLPADGDFGLLLTFANTLHSEQTRPGSLLVDLLMNF